MGAHDYQDPRVRTILSHVVVEPSPPGGYQVTIRGVTDPLTLFVARRIARGALRLFVDTNKPVLPVVADDCGPDDGD